MEEEKGPAREDLISKLPDALITEILLNLPTKEAVKTCVLSHRWKSLWLLIPGLDLDSHEFSDYNAFVGFMDRFLDLSRDQKSCLHKLKLHIRKDENDQSCFTRWLDFVATPKLKHLDVECILDTDLDVDDEYEYVTLERESLEVISLSLFICETLLYLRLDRVSLGSFESVYLPCVKTMHLESNVYANEECLESLISSCQVLEDLSIQRREDDNVKVLRVHSQTLTSLSVGFDLLPVDINFDFEDSGVLIDAPKLKYLSFRDDLSYNKIITNLGSLIKVNILDGFNLKGYMVRNFLTGISAVRDMKISLNNFTVFEGIMSLPQFCNLVCLEAQTDKDSLESLIKFLESCPNLKSLILDLWPSSDQEEIILSFVPQCSLSSLEFVEIKTIRRGYATEREVARYIAENSVILKKLVLRKMPSIGHAESQTLEEDSVFLSYLLALPRRSSTCEIVVC